MTAHPSAEWIVRQLTEACGWSEPPRYTIRDRDGAYGEASIRPGNGIGLGFGMKRLGEDVCTMVAIEGKPDDRGHLDVVTSDVAYTFIYRCQTLV